MVCCKTNLGLESTVIICRSLLVQYTQKHSITETGVNNISASQSLNYLSLLVTFLTYNRKNDYTTMILDTRYSFILLKAFEWELSAPSFGWTYEQMEFPWQMPYDRQRLPKMSFQQNVIIFFPVTGKKSYIERLLCSIHIQLKLTE